jgi:large subunit ribosomal protein L7/L12
METIELLAKQLANLKIKDVNMLAKILQDKYGIKPVDHNVVNNIAQSSNQPSVEKTNFNIVLKSVGSTKLKVIKTIKEVLGKSLTESKQLVDAAPNSVLKENEIKDKAELIKKQLEDVGAEIELV